MKRTLIALLAAGFLAGCVTPEQKQMTCDTARAVYEGYKKTLAAGHVATDEERIAVAGAAQFLLTICNWTSPNRGLFYVDENYIPVIQAP